MTVLDASRVTDAAMRRGRAGPLLAAGGFVAGCLVLRAVDPAGGPTICPFKAWTGLDCPGCGATRAAHQLLNGHVLAAMDLNVMFVLAVPFVLWWLGTWLIHALGGPRLAGLRPSPTVLRVAVVVLVVFGIVRNLPVAPLRWLGTGT
jgi:hypothetical protein